MVHAPVSLEPALDADAPALGARLRRIRESRGLTLATVAADTDLSRSFLSLVERDESDISFGRLHRLINYYGIHIGDLVPRTPVDVEGLVPAGLESRLHSPGEGIEFHLLAPDTERRFMPAEVILAGGAQTTDWEGHDGDEFLHVIEGKLELSFFKREPVMLSRGDSHYHGGREACAVRNPTSRETRLFVVISPPIF